MEFVEHIILDFRQGVSLKKATDGLNSYLSTLIRPSDGQQGSLSRDLLRFLHALYVYRKDETMLTGATT